MTATWFETFGETLDALPQPERFLLQSLRAWACCCRGRRLPAEPVRHAFESLGIPTGAEALDDAMTRLGLQLAAAGLPLCDGSVTTCAPRPTLH